MAQNSECKHYIVNSFWGIITSTTWTTHIASISLTVLHIYSNVLRIDYIQYREQKQCFLCRVKSLFSSEHVLALIFENEWFGDSLETKALQRGSKHLGTTLDSLLNNLCNYTHPHPTPPPHPPPLHLRFSLKENKEWDQRCRLGPLTAKQIKVSKTVFK